MIPRTGIIAGAGPLADTLAAMDPDAIVIGGFGGTPARVDFTASMDQLGALFQGAFRHGVREFVIAGRLALPLDFLPKPGSTWNELSARIVSLSQTDTDTSAFLKTVVEDVIKPRDKVLAAFVATLEARDYEVLGPHDIASHLYLPDHTYWGRMVAPFEREAAIEGLNVLEPLSPTMVSTAAVVRLGEVLGIQTATGIEAMLRGLGDASGAVLTIAGAVGQDMRLDTPYVSPEVVTIAASAGISGIIIAAGGVVVTEHDETRAAIEQHGMFLNAR